MPNDHYRDLVGSSFFNTEFYKNGNDYMLNAILSSSVELMEYFDKLLFVKDNTRVIYASNAYAFRARSQTVKENDNSDLQVNDLSFPFMNIAVRQGGVSLADTRLFASYEAKTSGVYIEELGKKVRLFPMVIQFEGTYFTTQMADAHLAISRLFKVGSSQLLLQPSLWYNGIEIKNILDIHFDDIVLDDQYTESDWLEKNRIHTVGFNISATTYLLDIYPGLFTDEDSSSITGQDGTGEGWVTKKVLLSYAIRNGLGCCNADYATLKKGVLDHLDQEVYWNKLNSPEITILKGKNSPPTIEIVPGVVQGPNIVIIPKLNRPLIELRYDSDYGTKLEPPVIEIKNKAGRPQIIRFFPELHPPKIEIYGLQVDIPIIKVE